MLDLEKRLLEKSEKIAEAKKAAQLSIEVGLAGEMAGWRAN